MAAAIYLSACTPVSPPNPSLVGAGSSAARSDTISLHFTTLRDHSDRKYDVATGINAQGVISGYCGSGSASDPSSGYTVAPHYGQRRYATEDYPKAAQTVVAAITERGDTAGYWLDAAGDIHAFVDLNGAYTRFTFRKHNQPYPTELLGIDSHGLTVGFYQDGSGAAHAFELNLNTGKFHAISPAGAASAVATGINGRGDVVGWLVNSSGAQHGWVLEGVHFTIFDYPGGAMTQPSGINGKGEVVGSYEDASGYTHGFLLLNPLNRSKWQSVNDPNAYGYTIARGIDGTGRIVGAYLDRHGNTVGFLATP